jgi:hypothetical protein
MPEFTIFVQLYYHIIVCAYLKYLKHIFFFYLRDSFCFYFLLMFSSFNFINFLTLSGLSGPCASAIPLLSNKSHFLLIASDLSAISGQRQGSLYFALSSRPLSKCAQSLLLHAALVFFRAYMSIRPSFFLSVGAINKFRCFPLFRET